MASIYQLNHPPNSWDPSATGLEDHPFFARGGRHHGPHAHHGPPGPPGPPPHFWGYGGPPHHGHHSHRGPPQFWGWGGPGEHGPRGRHHQHHRRGEWEHPENDEGIEAPVEENVEATGSTEKIPETHEKEVNSSSESESDEAHCRKHKGGKGRHGDHVRGFGKGGRGGKGGKGCHGHGPGHKGGPGFGAFGGRGHHHHGPYGGPGPFGPFGGPGHFGGPPHHHAYPMFGLGGPMGGKSHKGHKGGRRCRGMRYGGPDRDFMRQLRAFFGFPFGQNDVDFQPSVDVFDTPANYILHVSLPGAKKSDLNIDYDAEESVLRLTGIIHRPGMDEDLYQALVMEERAREVGVFEREIRLGTHHAPAPVIVDGIVAKLEDGVLNVTIPKIEELESKKVLVEDGDVREKDAMIMNEHVSRTITPVESEESESAEEAREYVKIAVQ
ncbi:hypothetical protein N7486_001307 [Penicillium sp. IBT 16267x]|nr:hypothetical protein N7486_001307 [Penicillium sp. IBT 16267x]